MYYYFVSVLLIINDGSGGGSFLVLGRKAKLCCYVKYVGTENTSW